MLNLPFIDRRLRSVALACAAALCLTGARGAQAQTSTPPAPQLSVANPPPLLLGAAWYPEQWPESRWEADLELMQKANIHLVRIGEFAWDRLEPEEGRYDLDWLERAINLAGKHGIYIVLGTPTKKPSAWMMEKYPEILAVPEGFHRTSAPPEHFNFTSPKYRQLVREIDEQLARRFGHNPYVIAWQLGNEISAPSYDTGTQKLFQNWLKAHYGTLDALNQKWHNDYHSSIYTSWNQIPIESPTGYPGLLISWHHFVSDTWRSFEKNEIDSIRHYVDPRQRITTNLMGWNESFDQYVVTKDLDFAAWDDPLGKRGAFYDPVDNGARNALSRGLKRKNFWVMETTFGSNMARGEMRAAIWADIGQGADTVSYWQWRDALNGNEEFHRGQIVNVDGTPAPIYQEIAQTGREFAKAGKALAGTSVHADVAIIYSFDSRWALEWQKNGKESPFRPVDELLSYYRPLHELGNTIDLVPPNADFSGYRLVIAPGMQVLPAAVATKLKQYVQSGGHLVLGERSGMLDEDSSRWPELQPGPLAALLGGSVAQYFALPKPIPVSGEWGTAEAKIYAEQLQTESQGAKVLMRFGKSNGWLDGQPAVITREQGKGSITYIGVWMNPEAMRAAAKWMMQTSGVIADLPAVPNGVEVQRRVGASKDVLLLENFSSGPQTVNLLLDRTNVFSGEKVNSVTLPVYGVAVLSEDKR